MKKTIKYLQDGEYHYATVKDVGDLEQLKTQHKEDLVTALNELFTTGGSATPTGYDDLVKKVNDTQTTVDGINSTITDVNGKVVANNEAITQAKKDLQDALTQFQTFNDEIEQAKKDAETKLADAKQALKDEFNNNLADAQKANQKQLEDKVAAIQGNLDTTSNTLNDVKTQLTNAKLDYGNVNTSIQKLNDMLATKLSSTDLDPLKTSIQNQETEIQQTKDSIATKAGKAELDVLSGRVSTAESKIKQQADEISLGVKKSELNGAIDNYQVEGTNRLRDTIDFDIDNGHWKLDQYSINSNTDVHPYDQAHDVSALVLQKTGSAKQDVDFTNEDLGNSFVISVWNKKDAQPQVWYGNTRLTGRQVADIKGDYERSFFTFIPTDVNVKTIMFKYDAGTVDQLIIGEPKLELGTKPKAYAPNPNDEHKQIVNTKAELKIASDKIESTVEKQTKTDDNINQLSSRVTQTEQGITATNDLITKTKDGLIKDYTGKINASAKSLSSEFEEKTNEKIGQITDSGENLILNSAFTNETDRKDKWQNISDKVNIVDDGNGLMWAKMSQSGLTADNPISLMSNYFPIKQGKITVGVDIKSDNTNGLSGAKILVLQTYNANKQRVDFTEISLENMGLTVQQLADGQSHRGVYRLGNDRSDAVYMTVKAVLPRNGSIYFTNFSAKLSSIDNGGYTPNAEDLKRQILNQKTKIEQNSQQITLKASSTELRDVRTIANGAVSSANNANKTADTALTNANSAKSTANNANNNATSAVSVANQANATATQAKNNASNAVNTANSANTTASNAVNTANQANTTANTANSNANQANSKITDMQTNGGGRNLLRNSIGKFQPNLSRTDNYTVYADSTVYMEQGQQYTVHANASDGLVWSSIHDSSYENNHVVLWLVDNKSVYQIVSDANTGTGTTFTWNHPSGTYDLRVDTYKADNSGYVERVMLEKGIVAHEWTPAPEDIQSQIDQARTDIQSTLTVANNGITAATNLKTTYDNYVQKNDANIKLLGDRITNEVSKITSNGGGRNYLRDSDKSTSGWGQDLGTMPIEVLNSLAGETITVSVDTEWSDYQHSDSKQNRLGFELSVTGSDGKRYYFGAWKAPATPSGKERVSTTYTLPANVTFTISNNGHSGYASINGTGKVSHAQVEIGAIAHDWSPAPEDTNSQIEAVSSKIDQTATSITSTVNSTKQDLQGQINSANTKITQTANSITEQLKSYSKTGDMQNYVNTTIQKTADGITSRVSGVESRVDEANNKIDKTVTNITSTVNSTKQDLQGKIDSANTKIDNTNTKIDQTATSINDKVSGVENKVDNANNKIDNLQIGGRNLLTGSKTMHGVWSADGTSTFNEDYYLVVRAIGDNMRIYQNPSEDTTGKLMSVSFDAEVPADSKNQSVQILVGPFQAGVNVTISGNAFKRYKIESWKWNSANKAFSIQFKNANDKINIRNIKLEFGNKATDWSPAPEDTDAKITTNSTAIDQNKKAIALKADQTTVNKTNGNVQQLQSQLKVQADRISSKVSSTDFTALNDRAMQNRGTVNAPDFNSLTQAGYYTITRPDKGKNYPTGSWGTLEVSGQATDVNGRLNQKYVSDNNGTVYTRQYNNGTKGWTAWSKGATESEIIQLSDKISSKVSQGDYNSQITQLKNLISSKVSSGDYNSQITQLKNDIALSVSKGKVISYINQEAGGNTIITVSNGMGKLKLNADTVEFSGTPFIPDAYITTLNADKLRFYDSSGNVATMSAGLKQHDDDKATKTIVLQYSGGYEVHASELLGSILTMHDNTIRLAVKAHGNSDTGSKDQYSGVYVMQHYAQLSNYRSNGKSPGIYITDDGFTILGDDSGNNTKHGDLNITSPQIYLNSNTKCQINSANTQFTVANKWSTLHADGNLWLESNNAQIHLGDNVVDIANKNNGNASNYDIHLTLRGYVDMTGWLKCMGLTQTSRLSTKTRIEPLDTAKALELINSADVATYQYKQEVAHGGTKRHASVIIDDVHDVAQYQTPEEFISEDRSGRSDGDIVGYLMGAVQELTKKIKTLESKVD